MANNPTLYLLEQIRQTIVYAQQVAAAINRGPGGREVALSITKLQEAEDWTKRAEKEINEAKS